QKLPKATAWFADVYSCGIFHRPFCVFLFWFFFLLVTSFRCGKPAGSRYESATLLVQRLKETLERDRHGKWNVCSDDVLRGLDYKDYALPAGMVCKQGNQGEICRCRNRMSKSLHSSDWIGPTKNTSLPCKKPTVTSGNASLWIRHRRRCRTGFNCCGIGSLVDPSLLLSSKSVER